ncbi:MAG: hypothetical protein JST30_15865 [Armatimonadetes bacterium]|nr:hypothetical protein [Armatimonadota bacterium]
MAQAFEGDQGEGKGSPVRRALRRLKLPQNLGSLLDVLVFLLNLWLMPKLAESFLKAIVRADKDADAQALLFTVATALMVLAPTGAVLKRWHRYKRGRPESGTEQRDPTDGCLFNPIVYFCTTALIFATANAFLLQKLYGKSEPDGGVFVGSVFLGIGLMVTHTVLVYRYFSVPKSEPRSEFLKGRASAVIGDACLFANMFVFQLVWNLLALVDVPPTTGPVDFVFRLFVLCFLALLFYFPPRMFYLADDIGKLRTWVTILQANLPVLIRVMIGTTAGPNV